MRPTTIIRQIIFCVLVWVVTSTPAAAAPVKLKHTDTFELLRSALVDTVIARGDVRFEQDEALLFCDSAVWIKGAWLYLWGSVRYEDQGNQLRADSLAYNLVDSVMYATGDSVIIISVEDSIRSVGAEAFYDRADDRMELLGDAHVRFSYPDTATGRTVHADYIRYEYSDKSAVAEGGVVITDKASVARAACVKFERSPEKIRLYDSASVDWNNQRLTGEFIALISRNGKPVSVEVWGGGEALFIDGDSEGAEDMAGIHAASDARDSTQADSAITDTADSLPVDSTELTDTSAVSQMIAEENTSSRLLGRHLSFSFSDGDLRRIDARGQAYSFYHPRTDDSMSSIANSASGDSISLFIEHDSLRTVKIYGSVEGTYVETGKPGVGDTLAVAPVDTITYSGERVFFDLSDSTIALAGLAVVDQAQMDLRADSIYYETTKKFLTAYADTTQRSPADSSAVLSDTAVVDSPGTGPIVGKLEPKPAVYGRVTLSDGGEDVHGNYVEYSMATGKGKLLQTATQYENAYYTGGELYRETSDVFFVDEGGYTTCEFSSPHFHFWSKHMKMINNDKMVARPVVFFIEKLPVFAVPYYVFPMRDGRRSGILNFRFGNFNQGGRFISNVGYYWAASEYWDIESWLDYYEVSGVALNSRVQWSKRYSFSGNFTVSNSWDSFFDSNLEEVKTRRWRLSGSHRQTIDPTFNMNARGTFLSDSRYFRDFSNSLDDRLNRNLNSQINFSKQFGRTGLSGSVIYDKDIDNEITRLTAPTLSFRLPSVQLFGSASSREEERWYHTIRTGYNSTLVHSETESNKFTPDTVAVDTTIDTTFDSLMMVDVYDTTITATTVTDTSRTKKGVTTYRHGVSLGPNFKLLGYFPGRVTVNYSETWFKIDNTDQSRDLGINTGKFHRTYSTSMSASLSTNLYGTVYPNVLGLKGLRHELSPSASYSYTPNIKFDSSTLVAAQFAGAPRGTTTNQAISFGLRNSFQAKVGEPENERIIDLLTLSSSISYDPDAATRRWSNLNTTFSTRIAGLVSMNGSMVHSFYEDGGLQSFDINSGVSFRGDFGRFRESSLLPTAPTTSTASTRDRSGSQTAGHRGAESRSWTLRLNHFYREQKNVDISSHFINLALFYQVTPNMSVNFTQRYDIANERTINRFVEVRRRLHCWEGTFSWTPTGSNQGFYFRLNVIDLPDVKYEKSLTNNTRGRFGLP